MHWEWTSNAVQHRSEWCTLNWVQRAGKQAFERRERRYTCASVTQTSTLHCQVKRDAFVPRRPPQKPQTKTCASGCVLSIASGVQCLCRWLTRREKVSVEFRSACSGMWKWSTKGKLQRKSYSLCEEREVPMWGELGTLFSYVSFFLNCFFMLY